VTFSRHIDQTDQGISGRPSSHKEMLIMFDFDVVTGPTQAPQPTTTETTVEPTVQPSASDGASKDAVLPA
jgi:hypothetical protein